MNRANEDMVISSTHQCRAPEKTPLRLRPNLPQALATDTLKPTMTGQIILGWIVPSEWLARCELRHNSSRSLRFNLAALNWMVTRTPLLTAFRRLHAHPYQIEYARSEAGERSGDTQLFVKEVNVDGRRYIVCRNKAEAEKDRIEREQIVAALDAQLKRGDKTLVGNSAYQRYLRKTTDGPAFAIDGGKLAEEARFDGVFVLRTNARVSPLQAVLRYRDLLQVEDLFRRAKAIMRTRPIFHSCDAAIRGHVFCSFLALLMQKHLDDLARKAGIVVPWAELLRDLDRLQQALRAAYPCKAL